MEAGTKLAPEPLDQTDQLPRHLAMAIEKGDMSLEQARTFVGKPCIVQTTRPATSIEELPIHLRIAVTNGMKIEQALRFAAVTEKVAN